MAKKIYRTIEKKVDVDIEIEIDELLEDVNTKDLLDALIGRKQYNGFDKEELGLFADLFEDSPLTDNLLDEQKMDVIREHLDKRTLEEIEHFFGVNLPYHNK